MKTPTLLPLNRVYRNEEAFSAELAKNLHLLGLGKFEEGETEAPVGTRRADIVAIGEDDTLVVECQFIRADWDHWGRLEGYARLKEASLAALVSENFEDLMVTTCELRNSDSEIGWYLIKAQATEQEEIIFQTIVGPRVDIQTEKSGREYSDFWAPIREAGLFSGKPIPAKDSFIAKSIRGAKVELFANINSTYVLAGWPIEKVELRDAYYDKFIDLDASKRESPKFAFIEVPVLDFGRSEIGRWDEIREKLVATGEKAFNILSESNE